MDEVPPPGHSKELTKEELDLLLSKLHSDRERAGEEYLLLEERLRIYFQIRGCSESEELAAETLRRTARKLAEGEEIRVLPAYCRGIARFVWMEYWDRYETGNLPLDELPPIPIHKVEGFEQKERLTILEKCLRELPESDAQIFVEYWIHDDELNSDARRKMAERLRITPTALRLRIFRIRARLQKSIRKCMGEKPKREK